MKKLFFLFAAMMVAVVVMAQTPTVSASKVTMKYCMTTYGIVPVKTNGFPVQKDGFSFPAEGTYVRKLVNVRGCDSVVTYVVEDKKGALDGVFTVASGKRVRFSMGLLQFRASNGTAYPNAGSLKHQTKDGEKQGQWRFAPNQYTTIGDVGNNKGQNNANSTSWQDIFSRGSSGYTMNPWSFTNYSTAIVNTNNDWGVYNAISNGGDEPGLWRCLKLAEYKYLLGTCDQGTSNSQNISPCRANAAQKWGWATVNGINGLVILPDVWTLPAGCSFTAQSQSNTYSIAQWTKMEENGAVFFPTTGYYQSSTYHVDAAESWYNTADTEYIWGLEDYRIRTYSATQSLYCFVRLVQDVQ